MVLPIIVLLFLLNFLPSQGVWARAQKPTWYKELKAICVGAEDHYYVDHNERKCCKCSPCNNWATDLPKEIDCYVPNNSNHCAGFATDCVGDESFDLVFGKHSTTVSTTVQSVSPVIIEAANHTMKPQTPVQTQVGVSLIGNDDVDNPVVVYGIMGIVALVVFCVVILLWKFVKTRSGSLQKMMHICRGRKPSDTGIPLQTRNAESTQSNRADVIEHCILANQSPPNSPSSEFGPQEMTLNEFQGINGPNELSWEISSSNSYNGSRDMPSGYSDTPRRMSNGVETVPQSVNSGTVISGPGNAVVMPNNRGTVYFNNSRITICKCNNDSRPPVGLPIAGNFSNQNEALGGNPNDNRLDHLPSPIDSDDDVRLEPCFPVHSNLGECVTSESHPLPRQEVGPGRPMRRQSSEISSTSTGPVENSAEDFQGGMSFRREVSRSRASHVPVHQTQISPSVPTTSIRGSSSLRGPVQHSNRRDQLLCGDRGTAHQFSQGDSFSISTGIHSPQADMESF